jgi:general secretion pathway protein G
MADCRNSFAFPVTLRPMQRVAVYLSTENMQPATGQLLAMALNSLAGFRRPDCVLTIMKEKPQVQNQQTRPQRGTEDGFTLIELLVVLGIIAMLAALVAPQVIRYLSDARVESARVQLKNVESALELYYLDAGQYPTSEQGLEALVAAPAGVEAWHGPYIKLKKGIVDPWGHVFGYKQPGEHGTLDVFTLGRDKAIGGEGEDKDIVNW